MVWLNEKLKQKVRGVFEPRYKRNLTEKEIEEIAENFVLALANPHIEGVINCCSGKPISVLDLVQKRCSARISNIQLNRGYYSYPDYESLAFWGVPSKLALPIIHKLATP